LFGPALVLRRPGGFGLLKGEHLLLMNERHLFIAYASQQHALSSIPHAFEYQSFISRSIIVNLNQRALETENIRSLLSSPMLFRAFSIDSFGKKSNQLVFPTYLNTMAGCPKMLLLINQSIGRGEGARKKLAYDEYLFESIISKI